VTIVWIYVDTRKQVGDVDHLKVFANLDAAEICFEENDQGVAFEDEVLECLPAVSYKQRLLCFSVANRLFDFTNRARAA
jgi:hypothetical protein